MLKILPQLFYQSPEVKKLLVDGLSCIIHKVIRVPGLNKEGYVSTHAITLVMKGTLRVEDEDGMVAQALPGQMIFLPKGLYMISDVVPQGDLFEALVFFFDEDVINTFATANSIKPVKDKCSRFKIMQQNGALKIFIESLLQLHSHGALTNKGLTKIKLLEFLHLLSTSSNSQCLVETLATLNNKPRRSLNEFMMANFSKPLSIEDYAYLTGRSLSSFRRDFIAQFGLSPKQWLIEKRLEKAYDLLAKNNTTVSQVCIETGYENVSHFIKAFHKRYGVPPKQFLMRSRKEILI